MIREFEGRTEKEAIDKAIDELNLDQGEFDVEVLEESRKGIIFKKGNVKIRVHIDDEFDEAEDGNNILTESGDYTPPEVNGNVATREAEYADVEAVAGVPIEPTETEAKIAEYVSGIVERMGYSARVTLMKRESRKVVYYLHSSRSAILIGRKGKNLDALQLIANVYSGRLPDGPKVVLDTEDYRARREEHLRRLALKTADQVRRNGGSKLLEPMNPFERRLIHTTLNDVNDITTESEGDGLYKQVRVFFKG